MKCYYRSVFESEVLKVLVLFGVPAQRIYFPSSNLMFGKKIRRDVAPAVMMLTTWRQTND